MPLPGGPCMCQTISMASGSGVILGGERGEDGGLDAGERGEEGDHGPKRPPVGAVAGDFGEVGVEIGERRGERFLTNSTFLTRT